MPRPARSCVTTTAARTSLMPSRPRSSPSVSKARPLLSGRQRATAAPRALHPCTQGETVVGADLRHHRGPMPGPARVQAAEQRDLDPRTTWPPNASPNPSRPDNAARHSDISINTVSRKLWTSTRAATQNLGLSVLDSRQLKTLREHLSETRKFKIEPLET